MNKNYAPWIVSAILLAVIMYLAYANPSYYLKSQFNQTKELCQELSSNHPNVQGLQEECMDEAISIYEKYNPDNTDDRDPYEDAQPGGYGLE